MAAIGRTCGTCFQKFRIYQKITPMLGIRTLLTDAYYVKDEWKKRLESPAMKDIEIELFQINLHKSMTQKKICSPLDIDVIGAYLEFIPAAQLYFTEEIFESFRLSRQSADITDSSYYAIARGYLDRGDPMKYLHLLRDKVKYGIFPEHFSSNMLMDHFIKKEKYREAARVAIESMLQEDKHSHLSSALALYACHKFLVIMQPVQPVQPPSSGEIEYIPIRFVRNPFFDDHFDIKNEPKLLGKTLVYAAKHVQDPLVNKSSQLIGWALYRKFHKGLELLQNLLESEGNIAQEALDKFEELLSNAPTRPEELPKKEHGMATIEDEILSIELTEKEKEETLEAFKGLVNKLKESQKISTDVDFHEYLTGFVKSQIVQYETEEAKVHKETLQKWEEERLIQHEHQLKTFMLYQQREAVNQKLLELKKKEMHVKFYENRRRQRLQSKRKDIKVFGANRNIWAW